MPYEPHFTITSKLLSLVEEISALRERIDNASVSLPWIPALQKDTRTRNGHASTAIEGNPLTLEQVRALEEGRKLVASDQHSQREVLNYFTGLRFIEKNAKLKKIRHDHLFQLHLLLADEVMDQGDAGTYRTIAVQVGGHIPPPANDVSPLMFELLEWWNGPSNSLSPVLSSAILHYRFEDIHPFADGNGRTGRAHKTLERVWLRLKKFQGSSSTKINLTPRQEHLLGLLRDHGSLAPAEIWKHLKVSRQGAMNIITPLIDAGLIEKRGTQKTGRYYLIQP